MGLSDSISGRNFSEAAGSSSQAAPPPPVSSYDMLGLRLHDLHREVIALRVFEAARDRRKFMVVNANAHMVVLAQRERWLKDLFARADIAFCDGAGVQFARRFLEGASAHRTTPPEWIGKVLSALGPDGSVFWIGGAPDVVREAAEKFERRYGVRTAGVQHGFFDLSRDSEDNRALVAAISAARPSLVLVNMGMPRQERWLYENFEDLDCGAVITAGALVDHAAGRVSRPPRWVANLGVEWLVRLVREPRRLWRRYLVGLPVFGYHVVRERLRRRSASG